jgi:uncharacterized membrane protein
MIERLMLILTMAAAFGSALVSCVCFGFNAFLTVEGGRGPAAVAAKAMGRVDGALRNAGFMSLFLGTAVASALLFAHGLFHLAQPAAAWLTGGGLAYLLGSFAVTVAVDARMRRAFPQIDLSDPQARPTWDAYLTRWKKWNLIRTAGALLAGAAFMSSMSRLAA